MEMMEMNMDKSRPYIFGKLEPCYEVNAPLWNVFCALTGRRIGTVSYEWTEHDVITFILSRGLAENEYRKAQRDHEEPATEHVNAGYSIRRNDETGSVMAVRSGGDSADDIIFVIGS